jgi:hypothetical protein
MRPATTKGVLFFDFDARAYLDDVDLSTATASASWRELKDEIYAVLIELTKTYPDTPFKCHPQQRDLEETLRRFEGTHPNLSVRTGSIDVDRIVEGHSIVIGFQTTALLETALTNRPALYCGWGSLHARVRSHLLPLMEPGFGITVCDGPEDLRASVAAHLDGAPPSSVVRRERLAEYFESPDGNAGRRYLAALKGDLGHGGGR